MPLTAGSKSTEFINAIRRLRAKPAKAYAFAVAAVATAILIRWQLNPYLLGTAPFITFYPAIILIALVSGLRVAIFAIVVFALAAWYLFLPPQFSWSLTFREVIAVFFFIFVSGLNVIIVFALDSAIDRLSAQEANIRTLVESAPCGFLVVDGAGHIRLVNATIERLFGYERTELLGKRIECLVPNDAQSNHALLRQEYLRLPEARAMGDGRELRARRKDGSEFPVEIGLNPIRGGRNKSVLATVIDITDRALVNESQQILIRELNHRTKNLFAVIQALAGRTLREAQTLTEAEAVLRGRLHALAQAYELMSDASLAGASIRDIIDKQVARFGARARVRGCRVFATRTAAQHFAMILHELLTNALKYGALSNSEGHIDISGDFEYSDSGKSFHFKWKEIGGPNVTAPIRTGFGTVITSQLAGQIADDVQLRYEQDGLEYEFRLRQESIADPGRG